MIKIKQVKKVPVVNSQPLSSSSENSNEHHEKAVTVMLENYAKTQINLTRLNDKEKKQKLNNARQVVEILANSLGAENLLQNMLVTQLLGVHELQQKLLPLANRSTNYPEHNQYYVNAITKLSNVFIQQINALQKLQGTSHQKVTVEYLHVSDGGNAIIGQVNAHSMREGAASEK